MLHASQLSVFRMKVPGITSVTAVLFLALASACAGQTLSVNRSFIGGSCTGGFNAEAVLMDTTEECMASVRPCGPHPSAPSDSLEIVCISPDDISLYSPSGAVSFDYASDDKTCAGQPTRYSYYSEAPSYPPPPPCIEWLAGDGIRRFNTPNGLTCSGNFRVSGQVYLTSNCTGPTQFYEYLYNCTTLTSSGTSYDRRVGCLSDFPSPPAPPPPPPPSAGGVTSTATRSATPSSSALLLPLLPLLFAAIASLS